jgi:hypothetical protein
MLISVSLSRSPAWMPARRALLWSANLTWIILVLMIAAFVALIVTYTNAGQQMTDDVIAVIGWPNRMLFVIYCGWTITLARRALSLAGGGLSMSEHAVTLVNR